MRTVALALLLATLAISGCTKVPPQAIAVAANDQGGQQTGGTVADSPTWFQAFSASSAVAVNDGTATVVWSMTLKDNNSESDIAYVNVFQNSSSLSAIHAVTAVDRAAASEPAAFGSDGWKVWTGVANDGILFARYQEAIATTMAAGTYRTGVRVASPSVVISYPPAAMQIDLVVRAPSAIAVASAPVDAAGVPQTGAAWGAWTASPGDASLASANYLKLTNTGRYPTPTVVVDFTQAAFVGVADASYTVPIDGNLQFASWEDATPASTAPNQGTYVFGATSPGGAITVTFAGVGDVVYVAYRIVAVPAVLPAQTYGASYTVTDVTT